MKTLQQQLEETYLLMRGILSEEDNKIITDILALDELSKSTLGKYINKAVGSLDGAAFHAFEAGDRQKGTPESRSKSYAKAVKRIKGVAKATSRLTKEQKETIEAVLEELEQEEV